MSNDRIKELIERLEKASGADRELDALIEIAIGCPCIGELPSLAEGWSWTFDDADEDGAVVVYCTLGNKTSKKYKKYPAPNYTASLDAALTLVPEGWGWNVGSPFAPSEALEGRSRPWADIWLRGEEEIYLPGAAAVTDSPGWNHFNAATPAIALCMAALRARAAQ